MGFTSLTDKLYTDVAGSQWHTVAWNSSK